MLNKLKNLIGGNSNGFYLEFNEEDNKSTEETAKTEPKKAEKQTIEFEPAPVKKEETTPEPAAVTEAEKQPETVAVTEEEETTSEPNPAKSAKKSKKTSIKSKKKSTESNSSKSSTPSGGASSWEQPFWVKVMYQNNGNSNGKVDGEKTFATDYLLPTSKSRRRPGPSLAKFKEMARQTKTTRI